MMLLCIVLGGLLGYVILRYFLPILLPFLLAWLISMAVMPMARGMSKRMHLSERLCAVLLLLFFLTVTVGLLSLGVSRLVSELRQLFERMIAEYGSFEAMLSAWMGNIEDTLTSVGLLGEGGADGTFREKLYGMLSGLVSTLLSSLASALPVVAGRILSALPSFLFASVIAIISAFYFCIDRDRITQMLRSVLPNRMRERLPQWRARMHHVSLRYVKAYLLLMGITFTILLVGFLLLRVSYALLLAVLAAVIDMLPILGVGTLLIPWAVILLIQKNYYLGFGLLILYAVCTLIRQIMEPKLIGKSLGLHPWVTILVTYVGWKLFGVLGLLFAPILTLIGRSLCLQLFPHLTNKD